MKMAGFQDILAWQQGHKLTLGIYKLTKNFPNDEKFGIVSQIRRSSASICANISEGYKKSRKEFARFLDITQGSLEETKYHLILSKDLKYCNDKEFEELFELANQIGRILNGLKSNLRPYSQF